MIKDIAMHTAAMRPAAVSKEELDPAVVEKEREILSAAARQEGKPLPPPTAGKNYARVIA